MRGRGSIRGSPRRSLRYLKVDEKHTRRVYYLIQVEYNSRGRKVRRQYIGSEPLVHALQHLA